MATTAATHLDPAAWRALGAMHRTDAERVPLSKARGRVLAEKVGGFGAGQRLEAAELGELAALGHAELPCARRPTVAVFTAGKGLRPAGQALAPGERSDACRPLIVALLQSAGLEPVSWPILPDEALEAALADAAQAFDLVVACGTPFLTNAAGGDGFSAAAFGPRAVPAVLVRLPEDRRAIAERWPATVDALIDAMQGRVASDTPAGATTAGIQRRSESATNAEGVEPAEAARRLGSGGRLIDVREPEEVALGGPAGAIPWPLSHIEAGGTPPPGLEALAGEAAGGHCLLICASGRRSLRAAALLRERFGLDACSVQGGFTAWRAAGLPIRPGAPGERTGTGDGSAVDADVLERYDRHLRLADVGLEGQRRLLAARVVVVGAGGLGSPAAFYLAAAGVGRITLVDDDRVERSNLQRQILHVDAAVGSAKVRSARERLLALNPSIHVEATEARVGVENVEALLRDADVVIDGSDNFATRYLVDAACLRLGIPLVYGAVERFTGQVSVFDAGRHRGAAPCYRCLFPEPPGADAAPNCAAAGVLGVLPGLVGLLQATEALKLVLGLGEPLVGRVLCVDARTMRFREIALPVDPDCPGCGGEARFDGYRAIETYCANR